MNARRLGPAVMFLLIAQTALAQLPPARLDPTVEARVNEILSQLTEAEKIKLLGGIESFYTNAVPRLGIPRLKMSDGPVGTRNDGASTAYPAGCALASTWDTALAQREGVSLGRDARARGDHFILGPGVNIYRVPQNGRNFEYFGEDPYLAGRIAAAYIQGVQSQGVAACVKHFAANNQESDRMTVDETISERALHEIYLPAFEAAVKQGHVCSVMAAYNCVNGQHMTANSYLLSDVVKKEWGFEGLVMSDWDATHATLGPALAGLDLEMPSPIWFNADRLMPLIKSGKIPQSVIDDKVRRLLRVMVTMHWLDRPQSTPSDKGDDPQGDATALAVAREGIVLLKNDGDLLPLDAARIHTIVLIGPNAAAYVAGGGSSFTHPLLPVTLLVGMRQVAAANLRMIDLPFVGPPQSDMGQFARTSSYQPTGPATRPALAAEYFDNPRLSGTPALKRDDTAIDFDWKSNFPAAAIKTHSFSVRWTATIRPPADGPYIFATRSDDGSRVLLDGKTIINDWSDHSPQTRWTQIQLRGHDDYRLVVEYYNRKNSASMQFGWGPPRDPLPLQQRQVVAAADAVIVCVGTEDTEGSDRPYNLPLDEDHFIAMAAAVNRHCVVIVNSGGNVAMSDWIDRVPALIQAWYPGQAGGRALAEILFGIVNPSGHLPDTFEKDFADSPAYGHYPGKDHAVDYAEGIYVGYRWYDTKHISPRFPFGFGLSYTTFSVGDLKILPVGTGDLRTFMVTADVTNTGHRAGATVIQLYVRPPPGAIDRPYQELKAFARVQLGPGRTKTVSMQLNRRSFAYWDTTIHDWKTVPGDYTIALGQSSRDIACVATLKW